jgi:serine/threonine protein kinase
MGKSYKKKITKKRRLRGGKFVASGSAGCIFRPALKCAGSNTRRNGYVSKMGSKNNIDAEWNSSNTPRRINTESKYFVYPTEKCNYGVLNASNEQEKCDVDSIGRQILQLPDGGIDLSKMAVPYEDMPAFFEGFVNIFDGIALLHSHGYAHRDIKLQNMVGIRNDDGTYQLRLIDFGLSDTFNGLAYYPRADNYQYWPYDMRLLDYRYQYTKDDVSNFMKTLNYRGVPSWIYKNPDGTSKLSRDFIETLRIKIHSSRDSKLQIIQASEVYALGLALYEAWYTKTSYISLTGKDVIKSNTTYRDIPDEISQLIFDLVADMSNADPFLRLSLDDTKVRLTRIIPFLYTVLI